MIRAELAETFGLRFKDIFMDCVTLQTSWRRCDVMDVVLKKCVVQLSLCSLI